MDRTDQAISRIKEIAKDADGWIVEQNIDKGNKRIKILKISFKQTS